VTFSCQRRRPLFSNARICETFLQALAVARERLCVQVYAWVLMPEHVHLLLRPHHDSSIEQVLRSVKMSVAKRVIARWKELSASVLDRAADSHGSPRFWQTGSGFDRNVRDEFEFGREVRYIHLNPVERGLVANPEDWRWSSVRWWMGRREGEFECDEPPGPPGLLANWKGYV